MNNKKYGDLVILVAVSCLVIWFITYNLYPIFIASKQFRESIIFLSKFAFFIYIILCFIVEYLRSFRNKLIKWNIVSFIIYLVDELIVPFIKNYKNKKNA